MTRVSICGVGMTRFTRQPDRTARSLVEEAVDSALGDAGLDSRDVQAVFCGSVRGGPGVGQQTMRDIPFNGAPIINVEDACASSSIALREAYAWTAAGLCEVAIACGVDVMSTAPKGPLELPKSEWMFKAGLNLPMWYAMQARRYMETHGISQEDIARVAVKSRRLSTKNPKAHFQTETSLDEVLASPMVADPLTLFQCCPKTDGASAVVVVAERYARRRGLDAVWIRASAVGSGVPVFGSGSDIDATPRRVARQAFEMASLAPDDLDLVEVHDAFTIGELIYAEALGICAAGEAARYLKEGWSMPDGGGIAINASGGLLSRGHPLGATGLAQIYELVSQLRGTAGARQVPGARLAAAHNMGAGVFELDANVCSTFILERDETRTNAASIN